MTAQGCALRSAWLRAPPQSRRAIFPMCYGAAFRSRRYAKALQRLGIAHKRTRPYTPKTNGKAERFVQTSLREWAYARAYDTSEQRGDELPAFLFRYNWQRPHSGINRKTPISRLGLSADNLLMLYT